MKKYAIRFRGVDGAAYATQDVQGNISSVDISEIASHINDVQRNWLWSSFFPKLNECKGDYAALKIDKVQIFDATVEPSFSEFWDAFDNKMGKKNRTQHLFKQLTIAQKAMAMAAIKPYKLFLLHNPNIAPLYPETYLSQERWLNEFDFNHSKYYNKR